MIAKLQKKIVMIVTFLLALAVMLIMLIINITAQYQSMQQMRNNLDSIINTDGNMVNSALRSMNEQNSMGFSFYLKIDRLNVLIETGCNTESYFDPYYFVDYGEKALESQKNFGFIDQYAFEVSKKSYGKIIVFSDVSSTNQQNKDLAVITSVIGVISVLLFAVLAIVLSFWLVKPVKETFEKQKLFISNASHELKTPLAVISANADVLETEIGDNKWLSYIKTNSLRMSELVNELLTLARLDDKSGHQLVKSEFNLSDAVLQTALPFESRMFEMGKKFDVDVVPDLLYNGDESAIKHIVSILIDNAVKYSSENAEISVKLFQKNNKRIIEVYNTGTGIPNEKLEKIFERFYREDEARNSKSGGYGLGLSIAREIAAQHNGSIKASGEYGKWIKFTVIL